MKRFFCSTSITCAVVLLSVSRAFSASPDGFVIWSEGGHERRGLKYVEIKEGQGPIASTKKTAVPKGSFADIECVISFDGKWLAFARQLAHSTNGRTDNPGDYHQFGNYDVYIAPLDQGLPATPKKVGHGYYPSWGDDSDRPTKTLYYSWCSGPRGGTLKVMKVTVGSDGSISAPTTQIENYGNSGDAHMQAAPNGTNVAYRTSGVWVFDKVAGTKIQAGGGCHPSWGPNSYWLMWARGQVGAFSNGKKLWSGRSGLHDYHYGFSNDGKWVIGRIGSSGNDQNTDYPIIYYPCNASKEGETPSWSVNRGAGETVGRGTWCDIHVETEPPGPSIELSVSPSKVAIGESAELTLTMAGGASGTPSWSVDGGGTLSDQSSSGATFTSDGTVGTYTVTATLDTLEATATINAIDPAAIDLKVNCGGPTSGEWESDAAYAKNGVSFTFTGAVDVSGVTDAPPSDVCKVVRHNADHRYDFADLPDGSYTVRIFFTDAYGDRDMDYFIEGKQVLDAFDPATEAGGTSKLCVKEFDVEVSDGNGLQIEAKLGGGDDVFEAALRITAVGSSTRGDFGYTAAHAEKASPFSVVRAGPGGLRISVNLDHAYTLELLDPGGRLIREFEGAAAREFSFDVRGGIRTCLVRLRTADGEYARTIVLK